MPQPNQRSRPFKKLSVDLPPEVLSALGSTPEEATACLKRLPLIEVFRRGEVSSGYAAEVLGITRWDFIRLLADHGVPYVDLTEDELREQVEAVRSRIRRHA